MQTNIIKSLGIITLAVLLCQCTPRPEASVKQAVTPEWANKAVIYEVNIRQYTPEGTFNAFAQHLPRLKEMGVDILWLMPIHPIGEKNRKGTLGSYYSIKDYTATNPNYGTIDDFKKLVDEAHQLGMKVIIDWVANHSAWDNNWVSEHPEWYKKNEKGEISAYTYKSGENVEYWTDVVGFDFNNKALWQGMTDAMLFWVKQTDIDGFRCDVAGLVPVDFWNFATSEINKVKPAFMLAENEDQMELLQKAFNANYAWSLHQTFNKIVKAEKNASDVANWVAKVDTLYPQGAMPMLFTSNHDENSWHGSEYERMGEAVKTFAALTFTLPGVPLIYSGQEAAVKKRLSFFEKDTILWDDLEMAKFYSQLTQLKKSNSALLNGNLKGNTTILSNDQPEKILSFMRSDETNSVVAIFNLSPDTVSFALNTKPDVTYKDYATHLPLTIGTEAMTLTPWEFKILTKQ
jgi:glycosidase